MMANTVTWNGRPIPTLVLTL